MRVLAGIGAGVLAVIIGAGACSDDEVDFTGGSGGQGGSGAQGGGGSSGTAGSGGGGSCGDGTQDSGEECDDGPNNSNTASDACRMDCTLPSCGDGVIDYLNTPAEQCDDGNTDTNDGCDASCQIEPPASCGDGNVDIANGEECDDGGNVDGDGCSAACLIEAASTCGDGNLDLANDEQCDDGNNVGGDGCSPTCQFETVGQSCGNNQVEGLEVCDDNNTSNGDGCNPTCNLTNTTSLFAGTLNTAGFADGLPGVGQIGGFGMLTVDQTHLYYGDGANRVVRRITINPGQADDGDINTIAGVPTTGNPPTPVDNADGSQAVFRGISSIANDGSTLWVCGGGEIRAVDLTDPLFAVTTVAGTYNGNQTCNDAQGTSARFDDIRGCTYWNGHVYLLDANCATLRRFDPSTGNVTTLAGVDYMTGTQDGDGAGGTQPFGLFMSPRYMTHDNSGVLYIADTNGWKIRTYNTVNDTVGTFAGNGTCGYQDGTGTSAIIRRPRGMTSDGTSIYWASQNEMTIRQGILASQEVSTLVGQHCSGASCPNGSCSTGYNEGVGIAALFDTPFGIAFHFPTNALFVLDSGNNVIRRVE